MTFYFRRVALMTGRYGAVEGDKGGSLGTPEEPVSMGHQQDAADLNSDLTSGIWNINSVGLWT